MEDKKQQRIRKLSVNEWILIGMIITGAIMIALRWNHISKEVSESVRSYFERAE